MSLKVPTTNEWRERVMNDQNKDNWIVYTVDMSKKKIKTMTVTAKGPGGVRDFVQSLDDEKVQFGGFKVTGVDSKGTVKSIRSKFIFVSWCGTKVKTMDRAGVAPIIGSVRKFFEGYNVFVDVTGGDKTTLDTSTLEKMLRDAGGAHQVQSYDWENKTVVKKKKRRKKKTAALGQAEPVEIPDGNAFRDHVMKDSNKVCWCVYSLDPKKRVLKLENEGPGGVADAVKTLKDDQIQYVGFRVTGVDRQGTVVSKRSKFVYVTFVGKSVGVMSRAAVGPIGSQIAPLFKGATLSISTLDGDRAIFDVAALEKQLRSAAGSHQVVGYDWTNSKDVDTIVDENS